jgi:hypothetical protein
MLSMAWRTRQEHPVVKGLLIKIVVGTLLLSSTVVAYGASFHGWFLPGDLKKPVSLREGSTRHSGAGFAYFLGRTHAGGGYRGGK